MTDVLELVAFDIETTGFAVSDEVTVTGFAVPLGARVFCQAEMDAPDLQADMDAAVDTHVNVSTHGSEAAVLDAMAAFAAERIGDEETLLVAYNGETWHGGFDLPFIRTRLAKRNVQWPFADVPYADLFPIMKKQFNTATAAGADGDTSVDLETAYATLCNGTYAEIDPFEDSADAVTAFEEGRFAELVLHNVADVLRTRALGKLAQRYCGKSDFKLKSLTPVVTDQP